MEKAFSLENFPTFGTFRNEYINYPVIESPATKNTPLSAHLREKSKFWHI